ncbi:COQ9 family protein [Amaricoccus solimangrovi]|uniref:COQ9 family protein n=2 Tax=Amaricoccus solimangrovi TaxID=2589815 RepID=A0A501WYY1_9RHOB|nr:COQ9 family protein [Amaricoccus solimangrovi]
MPASGTEVANPVGGKRLRAHVIAAALPHVPFDGWTDKTLALAIAEAGVDPALARFEFARGGLDLLLAYHRARDRDFAERLAALDLEGLRFRDKVAVAIDTRLDVVAGEKDAVRRGVALLALPRHAPEGALALWHTADAIWTALGDTSDDFNWYSKRATLSAIYSSALLYWLGEDEPGFPRTRAFTRRRIEDLMRFEKAKARIGANPVARAVLSGPLRLLGRVRAPAAPPRRDLPGWYAD